MPSTAISFITHPPTHPSPHLTSFQGYEAIARRMGTFRTRRAKPPPPAGMDSFGFCTWDAFYR